MNTQTLIDRGFERFQREPREVATPMVTILREGDFGLNHAAFQAMGEPAYVQFYYAGEPRQIALQPVAERTRGVNRVRRQSPATRSYSIAARAFCDYYGITRAESYAYQGEVVDGILFVDLTQQAVPVTRKPGRPRRTQEQERASDVS